MPKKGFGPVDFYPRSPCGERRQGTLHSGTLPQFLSTLSLRRATPHLYIACRAMRHFYPRSPCGERHSRRCRTSAFRRFLSTLSLRRATLVFTARYPAIRVFLSTLSLRRATVRCIVECLLIEIFLSTLSLRRATPGILAGQRDAQNFYPRSPCGERPLWLTATRST